MTSLRVVASRLDPGIGFAKDLEQSLTLLRHCGVSLALVLN